MAADSNPGGFGGKLRDARERRGISLRQIADTTKISIAVLEGLERNDISHLPGGIFGRGFVRSYASAVGLNPESAIRDFIAQFPDNAAVTAGHPSVTQIDDNEALESNRRIATTALRILGLSLPVAGVVMSLRCHGPPRTDDPPQCTGADDLSCGGHEWLAFEPECRRAVG